MWGQDTEAGEYKSGRDGGEVSVVTCVCSHVSLQVKGVVKALATIPAGMALD